jgi:hypothetical protein
MTVSPPARLEGGQYECTATCPHCGQVAVLTVSIASRLVAVRGETARLGLRVKSSKVAHACDQLTLDAVGEADQASS